MDVREKIDAFEKFRFESQFQKISSGGAISYVEIPNLRNNLEALEDVVKFIYENIQYAEFNTKSDYCQPVVILERISGMSERLKR